MALIKSRLKQPVLLCLGLIIGKACLGQSAKPGLPGMSPSKWITLKHTQAPNRSFQYNNGPVTRYEQEDFFFKLWLPVLLKQNLNILVGPQFRTEQLELSNPAGNEFNNLSHWNLRSWGVDLRSCWGFDSTRWLLSNFNVNQSGNLSDVSTSDIPLNYTFGVIYLSRKSANTELGFGFLANKNFERFAILPAFIYNHNFSKRNGLEVSLPYKIAFRNNLSPADVFYIKAEGSTRSYSLFNEQNNINLFRRTDIDFGVSYNRSLNKMIGFEVFTGYRYNLTCDFPGNINSIKRSGIAVSLELYIKPPLGKKK